MVRQVFKKVICIASSGFLKNCTLRKGNGGRESYNITLGRCRLVISF